MAEVTTPRTCASSVPSLTPGERPKSSALTISFFTVLGSFCIRFVGDNPTHGHTGSAGRHDRRRERRRGDPRAHARAAPDSHRTERDPSRRRRQRGLHGDRGPGRGVSGARRPFAPRLGRGSPALRPRDRRAGLARPRHPRPAPLEHGEGPGRDPARVPARRATACGRPGRCASPGTTMLRPSACRPGTPRGERHGRRRPRPDRRILRPGRRRARLRPRPRRPRPGAGPRDRDRGLARSRRRGSRHRRDRGADGAHAGPPARAVRARARRRAHGHGLPQAADRRGGGDASVPGRGSWRDIRWPAPVDAESKPLRPRSSAAARGPSCARRGATTRRWPRFPSSSSRSARAPSCSTRSATTA